MISGPALAAAIGIAVAWFLGAETVAGLKWVGREAARGGVAIVHLLKKVPHPHADARPSARAEKPARRAGL